MSINYYVVLGVQSKADINDIKSAYKKLAIQYHPDKSSGFEDKFKEINEAYSVLSDDKKRADYDSKLSFSSTFKRWGYAFGESTVAKDFGKSYKKEPPKGSPYKYALRVSVNDCINGATIEKDIEYNAKCPMCDGTGARTRKQCPVCKGVAAVKKIVNGEYVITECENCHSSGYIISDVCLHCKGTSIIKKTQTIKIKLPEGVKNNQVIKLNGLGNAGVYGGARGDLHLYVFHPEDDKYTRKGDDLYIKYDVSPIDLILGKTFDLDTPTGNITVNIPAGTQPTAKIRVKNKGINDGNLYIAFKMVIPTQLSPDELELYTKLRNLEFSI